LLYLSGPAPWLLAWLTGTALQLFQPVLWELTAYALLAAVGCLTAWWWLWIALRKPVKYVHSTVCWRVCTALCVGISLSFALTGMRAVWFSKDALDPALEGLDLQVTGVVSSMPKWHSDGVRFGFQVEHAQRIDNQHPVDIPKALQAGWYTSNFDGEPRALPDIKAGDRWQLPLRLKRPRGLVNPGGFDAELWLWEQGVHATAHVREGTGAGSLKRLQSTWQFPIEQWRQHTRTSIVQSLKEPRFSGQTAALLLGDQAAISQRDWDVFRITGIAHLMSISGLHITLWAWVARWLISRIWRYSDIWGRSWCLVYPAPLAALSGGVLFAFAYAVFSGWGVPAQRTVVMLMAACWLRVNAMRWPLLEQWLLAAVVVCVWDPWALLQAGFWLSFVAVGMLFLMPAPASPLRTSPEDHQAWWKKLLNALRHLLREQSFITLGLAPLTLLLFQQVSVVGLLVNLYAIPWVTFVVTPLAFAGVLWSPLWLLCSQSLQLLMATLEPLPHLPWAVWQTAAPPWWLALIGMAGGALFISQRQLWRRISGAALVMPMFFWQAQRPPLGVAQLLFADIGQGNAVLVRTAQHSLLFDTGPRFGVDSDAGQRVLLPVLQTMDEHIDALVLSHQDSDHTGGALSVYKQHKQTQLWSSITYAHWLSQHLPLQRCAAGQAWEWDGVQFDFIHPLATDYDKTMSPNNRSCVLRIRAQAQTVLLTADIEAMQENALVQRLGKDLKADLLLVPHHGSKTSSTVGFIDAVQPRWALLQHGYRNRYGHPAPVVVQRYAARGVRMLDSPKCGAMHWRSDQPEEVLCQRELDKRYWRFGGG
jgi:competence protein ComEC